MDKYKIEGMNYRYNWIDVGPGPPERGGEIGLYSIIRNYRKTFTDLKSVLKEVEKMQKCRYGFDIIIVSKFEDKQYVPGKLIIPTFRDLIWKSLEGFEWKRCNTRLPMFNLFYKGKLSTDSYGIPSSKTFIKREPTINEVMSSVEKFYKKNIIESVMNKSGIRDFCTNTYQGEGVCH